LAESISSSCLFTDGGPGTHQLCWWVNGSRPARIKSAPPSVAWCRASLPAFDPTTRKQSWPSTEIIAAAAYDSDCWPASRCHLPKACQRKGRMAVENCGAKPSRRPAPSPNVKEYSIVQGTARLRQDLMIFNHSKSSAIISGIMNDRPCMEEVLKKRWARKIIIAAWLRHRFGGTIASGDYMKHFSPIARSLPARLCNARRFWKTVLARTALKHR